MGPRVNCYVRLGFLTAGTCLPLMPAQPSYNHPLLLVTKAARNTALYPLNLQQVRWRRRAGEAEGRENGGGGRRSRGKEGGGTGYKERRKRN